MVIFILLFVVSSYATDVFFDGFEGGNLNNWLTFGIGVPWNISITNPYVGIFHAEANPRNTVLGSTLLRNFSLVGYQNITVEYSRRLIGLDSGDEWLMIVANATQINILEQLGSSSANDPTYVNRSFFLGSNFTNNSVFSIFFTCIAGAVTEFCRLDNVNISGTIISVPDSIIPSISNALINATSDVDVHSKVKINATVVDNFAVGNVTIQYAPPNKSPYNATAPNQNGNEFYNDSLVLDSDGKWVFTFFANDTTGNNAVPVVAQDLTGNGFIEVVSKPVISDARINYTSNVSLNLVVKINATVIDAGNNLGNVTLQIDPPNDPAYSTTKLNKNGNEFYNDSVVLSQTGKWIFTIFANDTNGNNAIPAIAQDMIGNNYIQVIDTTPPVITNALANVTNNASLNQIIKINATVTDAGNNLANVTLQVDPPNDPAYNVTKLNKNGNEFYNDTVVLSQSGQWIFTFFANDTAGNTAVPVIVNDMGGEPYLQVTQGNGAPIVWFNKTLVNGTEKTPIFEDTFVVQVNISDPENDPVFVNFTITAPNGTKVLDNTLGSYFIIGDYSIWNSSSYTIDDYGVWNWSFAVSDGVNIFQVNSGFRVYSDIIFFPQGYIAAPKIKNDTHYWNLSLYHKSSENYVLNFTSVLNSTFFTVILANTSAAISSTVYNTSNLFKNAVTITTGAGVIEKRIYYGNITIQRLLDSTNYTVPLILGINPPSGDIDAYNISGTLCDEDNCDVDEKMENDETKIFRWLVNNTGDFNLTNCLPSVTGFNVSNFGNFSPSNFDLGIFNATILELMIKQPTINTYYGQLDIICVATQLGFNNSLGSETSNVPSIKLLVVADSGSAPGTGGGGAGGGGGGVGNSPDILPSQGIVGQPDSFASPTSETNVPERPSEGTQLRNDQEDNPNVKRSFFERLLDSLKRAASITGGFVSNAGVGAASGAFFTILLLLMILVAGVYENRRHSKLGKSTKSAQLITILRELKNIGYIEGSSIVSRSGFIIASTIPTKTGAEKFAATSALMIKSVETALEKLHKGTFNHIILNTSTKRVVAVPSGKKAILVCLIKPQSNLGLMLLEIKKAAHKIEKAI